MEQAMFKSKTFRKSRKIFLKPNGHAGNGPKERHSNLDTGAGTRDRCTEDGKSHRKCPDGNLGINMATKF